MTGRQAAQGNAFLGADEFSKNLISQFTHNPPTKVDEKFVLARANIAAAIVGLGGKAAIQSANDFRGKSAIKKEARENLEDFLSEIDDSADAISNELDNPEIKARFRRTDRSDASLVATARGMASIIKDLSLNDEFEGHGYGPDLAAKLTGLAKDFEELGGKQATSLGTRKAATKSIPAVIKQGKAGIASLDSIFSQVFKDKPEILIAWETASHVERAAKSSEPTKPASGSPVA